MSEANDYSYNIASVEKTIRLIELLAETNGELSVLQIAKRLDTHASSADRFLITLQNLGYVDKREQIGKYRLTDRLLKIASNLIVSHPLTVRYLDVMHTLAYNLNATTHIMAFTGSVRSPCTRIFRHRTSPITTPFLTPSGSTTAPRRESSCCPRCLRSSFRSICPV